MSEPTPEPQVGKEAAGTDPAAKKAAPSSPPVLLIVVIVAALAAGAASGALLVAPQIIKANQAKAFASAEAELAGGGHGKKKKKKDSHGKKDEKGGEHGKESGGKSPIFRLDNLIVNPSGAQGQHFLMCSIAFEVEDAKLSEILREHEVQLRDVVISELESYNMEQLTAPGVRDSIRIRIAGVAMPLLGEEGEDTELKVFLPQFVIQ